MALTCHYFNVSSLASDIKHIKLMCGFICHWRHTNSDHLFAMAREERLEQQPAQNHSHL